MKINSISISGSSFFCDDFALVFSDELNCIMGGRGTGKSTIVHLIDACINSQAEEDPTTGSILINNLGADGEVMLHIELDGEQYSIYRRMDADSVCIRQSDNVTVSIDDLRLNEKVDLYKALSIEEIGRNPSSRLELIDTMIWNQVSLCKSQIRNIVSQLDQNSKEYINESEKINDIKESLSQSDNIDTEAKSLEDSKPKTFNQNQQNQYESVKKLQQQLEYEAGLVFQGENILSDISQLAETQQYRVGQVRTLLSELQNSTSAESLNPYISDLSKALDMIYKLSLDQVEIMTNSVDASFARMDSHLKNRRSVEAQKLKKLFSEITENKAYYERLDKLEKKKKERQKLQKTQEEIVNKRKSLWARRTQLMAEFIEARQSLFETRLSAIKELNDKFDKRIKITLLFGGLNERYKDVVREILKGKGFRYNTLLDRITAAFTPDEFADILIRKDVAKLQTIAGIDEQRTQDVLAAFDRETILSLQSIYCDDLPQFFLLLEDLEATGSKIIPTNENYKPTEELSTGQRCTTVLPIIFEVSKNPLIIDQPEDNLDNKYISEKIHFSLRELKTKRQLIFITHNPNIPVLADASYNAFLQYENSKSIISEVGSLQNVKGSILKVLEGGKDAFRTRRKLYKDLIPID